MKKQIRFILMLLIVLSCAFAADAQSTGIIPTLDELVIDPYSNNAIAVFGYNNPNPTAMTIKPGPSNFFFPSPQNRGQTETFQPGNNRRAFTVIFDRVLQPTLTWILDTRTVEANTSTGGTLPTTAFTYQGRLTDAGAPANGLYDLQFALLDAQTAGTQQGSTIVKDDVQVTNGIFTVELDFGAGAFARNANNAFLEIGVRTGASTGAFTSLAPRQSVTPSPYAIRAFSALSAVTATRAFNFYVQGKLTLDVLGTGGSTQICHNSSEQLSNCSSSLRYKTNIAPFNFGLNLVNRLRPITFDWKDGGMRDLGLGAEDVAAVEPLLATYNKDGQVEGVKYDRIGVVLLNAVKEQQTQIEQQRQQLTQQQALIEGLRKLLCQQNPQAEVCK